MLVEPAAAFESYTRTWQPCWTISQGEPVIIERIALVDDGAGLGPELSSAFRRS